MHIQQNNAGLLYKVLSGRIKIGPRIVQAGDTIELGLDQAHEIFATGQLQFVRASRIYKKPRGLAPGERFERIPRDKLYQLKVSVLREYAMRIYGVSLKGKTKIIREIGRIKAEGNRWGTAH